MNIFVPSGFNGRLLTHCCKSSDSVILKSWSPFDADEISPAWVNVLKRIPSSIKEAVEVNNAPRVGYNRIRRDESAQCGVVIAGIIVHQPRGVTLLAGEGAVGLEDGGCAAFRAIGIVCAAGCSGTRTVGGQ